MFKPEDYKLFEKLGINQETVKNQIENFKSGFPFSNIVKPAILSNGILAVSQEKIDEYEELYKAKMPHIKTVKFVPASGAASRMFKELFEILEKENYSPELEKSSDNDFFFSNIEKFAFYNYLKQIADKKNVNLKKDVKGTLKLLLTPEGLNYGNLPKGLLKFHKYPQGARTAAYEHFIEALEYSKNKGSIKIHFTVSPEHKELFDKHFSEIKNIFKSEFNVDSEIEMSEQKKSTDTIAVDMNNKPFRNPDKSLLFRPAGHGALIENLNNIDADIIFVKNIDNVVPEKFNADTIKYKKALAGLLIKITEEVYDFIRQLKENIDQNGIEKIEKFVEENFFIEAPLENKSLEQRKEYLLKILDRPTRICGMVKNEGEPGGGPFFVKDTNGQLSLQIVESAQIDFSDSSKRELVSNATHFNPVDLILSVKNYKGKKFNLLNYIDHSTGFISKKSKDGKDLKAMELPGLWNGAMAFWNTIFVEVPVSTFNPVKTVNDLLRKMHQ